MEFYAQGDVLIERVADTNEPGTPVARDPDGAVVLQRGEVTGHRHAFYGGATLFRDEALARDMPADLYIGHVKVADGGAVLLHEEHSDIELPPGVYRVRRQKEYPARERARVVQD